ncbi:MAG: PepSY domain-containing protein [Cytophagaceae bacterium]|jgi:uncharacterized iron-regulated membrane protein|nr:PepSY domain-containing protein [Cytophagaceae bacterium]
MTWKKGWNYIHLYLGLASGIVILVVALTGALWAFETEISDWIYSYRKVEVQNKTTVSMTELKRAAIPYLKGNEISYIQLPAKNRSAELGYYKKVNDKEEHVRVYLNPYTAEVLHVSNNEHTIFDYIIELHVNLMLGEVGKYIVDVATLILLVLVFTGIILWWPKNKAAAKQRFWFKWKQGVLWKRKNYDLHNILGFYSSFIAIFIILTGLAWGFTWVNKSIYFLASGGQPYKEWPIYYAISDSTQKQIAGVEDKMLADAKKRYIKPFEAISIWYPEPKKEAVAVYLNPDENVFYNGDAFYYDPRTGDAIAQDLYKNFNAAEKLRSMYYDIHVGKILGLPGQFLVFFASLIVASLPVTGFYIWYGRNKKKIKVVKLVNNPALKSLSGLDNSTKVFQNKGETILTFKSTN